VFPKLIAPWQPLKDVRAITTELEQGVSATVRLEGDVFETEDQRNYGDASFKTYSTPQDLPKPVQVRAGDVVRQRVIVSVSNPQHQPLAVKVRNKPPHISAIGETMPKPNIGLQAARQAEAMSDIELQRVRDLALGHLRADIFLAQPDWKSQLKLISEEANRLAVPLHLALHVGAAADTEISEFARAAEGQNLRVALWIVQRRGESFPSAQTLELARRTLAAVGEKVPLAGAASPFFTEFNRNRPGNSDALVCYPLAPQVHLTDRTTVMENIADVAETIHSAHALTGRPVVVSPITLRRAEPKASRTTAADALPGTVDERQVSLFTAAWTVGHLAYLCGAAGLHSATFFEMIGWRGVMESNDGSPLPAKFFSIPGSVFPVYHVFADVAPFDRVRGTRCTRPLEAVGVTLVGAKGQRTLVANLLPRPQEVTVALEVSYARVRRLNAATAEEAMRTPESFRKASSEKVEVKNDVLALHLAAYEVVTIDV
jgi:hypothetical protein